MKHIPIALVVDDDVLQRELIAAILEEFEVRVVRCDSGEKALRILAKVGHGVSMVYTDMNLAGKIDGVELSCFAAEQYPNAHVIVSSGRPLTKRLPDGVTFLRKPWNALDLVREAERSLH